MDLRRGVKLAVRFLLGALGLFAVLYLLAAATLSAVNQVLAAWAGEPVGPAEWELFVSLGAATVGAVLLAIPFAQGVYSLERLWLFAVALYLLAVAVLAPLLWAVPGLLDPAAEGTTPLVVVGYGLFVLTVLAAFVVAYRGGYERLRGWLANV